MFVYFSEFSNLLHHHQSETKLFEILYSFKYWGKYDYLSLKDSCPDQEILIDFGYRVNDGSRHRALGVLRPPVNPSLRDTSRLSGRGHFNES